MSPQFDYRPEVFAFLRRAGGDHDPAYLDALARWHLDTTADVGPPADPPDADLWGAFCVAEGLVESKPWAGGSMLEVTDLGRLVLKLNGVTTEAGPAPREPRGRDQDSVADHCVRYGVAEGMVLGWIRSGELKAVNVGRRAGSKKPRWRVTAEALAAFEASRTPEPPAPKAKPRTKPLDVIEFYK